MTPKTPAKAKTAEQIATVKVREHERKMHGKKFAKGGDVRGVGAARPQKFKEC